MTTTFLVYGPSPRWYKYSHHSIDLEGETTFVPLSAVCCNAGCNKFKLAFKHRVVKYPKGHAIRVFASVCGGEECVKVASEILSIGAKNIVEIMTAK